jgi:hypothetical protein
MADEEKSKFDLIDKTINELRALIDAHSERLSLIEKDIKIIRKEMFL